MFTTSFNWIFGKIQFCEYCRCKFHFCRREIDCTAFESAFFCRHEITWVRKTELGISNIKQRIWGFYLGPNVMAYMASKQSKNALNWAAKTAIFTIRYLVRYLVDNLLNTLYLTVKTLFSFAVLRFFFLSFVGKALLGRLFFCVGKNPLDNLTQWQITPWSSIMNLKVRRFFSQIFLQQLKKMTAT